MLLKVQLTLPSPDFAPVDSTNRGPKIFGEKKIPECSQKQKLNLPHSGNYLHSIYIVLGILSNPEMI